MAMVEHSLRWGCPTSDDGFVQVPNFVLRQYAKVGLTGQEFLVILHLAAYRYETPGSTSFPAVATLASEMGCSERYIQRLLTRLEKKGMVRRHYREGRTTVYDVSGYAEAARTSWVQGRGEPQFTPCGLGGEPQFTPGVNPGSPEEENIRRVTSSSCSKPENDDDDIPSSLKKEAGWKGAPSVAGSAPEGPGPLPPPVASAPDERLQERIALLRAQKVGYKMACSLAAQYSQEEIEASIADAFRQSSLRNPAGYIADLLRSGAAAQMVEEERSRCPEGTGSPKELHF